MSRSSSVEGRRDIPARRGVEEIFSSRQEGCQGLPEDRRGNQSSHGKLTKLVRNTKKLFIYTFFSTRATYIYNFFFKSSVQQEDTRIFLFATPSLSRKETTGRSCSRNIQFRVRHLHGDSFFSPPPPSDVKILVGWGSSGHTCKEGSGVNNFPRTRRMPRSSRRSSGQPI